ncbi:hypothetical protein GBAR_LOCUS12435 [Geodia barretti]|uniref:Uncharacterized protein n=1 Tax=Geodia barretti TaxID=519541 RepID=A0AA35WHN1_GEOBA|nr:hypothetical protein GBAR_LOCUS12435 [Geodia barretti]
MNFQLLNDSCVHAIWCVRWATYKLLNSSISNTSRSFRVHKSDSITVPFSYPFRSLTIYCYFILQNHLWPQLNCSIGIDNDTIFLQQGL